MSEQTIPESLLAKVRALLAKAEDPAATTAEAEAFTAKATELMAKYGIEQALIADSAPGDHVPTNRIIDTTAPWAGEKAKLLYWLSEAMGCQSILLGTSGVCIFGFESDLARVELLYTSLLLQMIGGLAKAPVPYRESPKAYRRSWLIGFRQEVVARVKAAEARAAAQAQAQSTAPGGRSTEMVLADRQALVKQAFTAEYPKVRRATSRYSGSGYKSGRDAGSRANIGQAGVAGGRRAIGGAL